MPLLMLRLKIEVFKKTSSFIIVILSDLTQLVKVR